MKKFFNPHSLRGKMFIICMVISCGIMLVSAQIIIRAAVNTITDNAYTNIFENLRHADSNLNALLDDAVTIGLAIASNRTTIIRGLRACDPLPAPRRRYRFKSHPKGWWFTP